MLWGGEYVCACVWLRTRSSGCLPLLAWLLAPFHTLSSTETVQVAHRPPPSSAWSDAILPRSAHLVYLLFHVSHPTTELVRPSQTSSFMPASPYGTHKRRSPAYTRAHHPLRCGSPHHVCLSACAPLLRSSPPTPHPRIYPLCKERRISLSRRITPLNLPPSSPLLTPSFCSDTQTQA